MADRTPLKVADRNDIAADDPFAELTRIMGFDPRQPVRQPTAERGAPANQPADEGDFDIDLEKELMGEFDAVEEYASPAQQSNLYQIAREPAYEPAGAPVEPASPSANDDELMASFEQDFVFDDAADHAHFVATPEPGLAPEVEVAPEPEVAFDDDFEKAVTGSFDALRFEDEPAIDQEMAASLDQDFQVEHHEAADVHQDAVEAVQSAAETAFDADFDNAVQMSLEDEMAFDSREPEQYSEPEQHPLLAHQPVAAEPAEAYAAGPTISEDDFTGHFDQAIADVDLDLGDHEDFQEPELLAADEPEPTVADEPAPVVEAPTEAAHFAAEPDHVAAEPLYAQSLHDDFELSFRDALDEHDAPAVEPVAVAPQPVAQPASAVAAPIAPVEAVEPPKPAAGERSLEDELNALLGAMTARPMPALKDIAPTPSPVVQAVSHASPKAAEDLRWDADRRQAAQSPAAEPVVDDLDDLLASELDREDIAAAKAEPSIDFDDDAFDAAFAKGIEADQAATVSAQPSAKNAGAPFGWSASAEPAKWSRSTPTTAYATQASFAAQPAPVAPAMAAPVAAPQAAAPAYRNEPTPDYVAPDFAVQATPAAAPQARQHDEMPDVETVDVPERVVALADDLDIPELSFEEDQPASPAYDDLDAEFASLLTDMNSTEIAAAPAPKRGYEDDSYNAGFKGYDRRDLRDETPAAPAAQASFAATNDYDDADLPGSRPVSQADDLAANELDYDPELEEAMAIPGLAERQAARPRRRGMMIAGLVGAVVIAGGLGALAFSFGGKGGSEAPVIVKADNAPIKVKPENPGGTVVPNQDNKVYDAVVKGGTAKPAEPVQQKLVNTTEQPVDLASKEPAPSRVVDLTPNDTDASAGTDASNADTALPGVAPAAIPENAQAAAPQSAQPAAPMPKSEDRIAQVLQQDANSDASNNGVVAVAPRKVKTMMVKPDGSLVPREDPAPAAPKVAAAEPTDPAPQHVAPAADAQATGTVDSDQAAVDQSETKPLKPAKPAAKAQSSNTPAVVPVAPPRPSDQPVDIVGEVKPDQVASIDPASSAGGGSWSMQIASQPTVESAQSTYQDLQRRYGSVLSGRTASIVKAEVAGKGTFYRVRVPAKSRNDAIALCTSYKAAGGNCFVSR
ncbi:SPOR domain-containing protein [Mesorhizobium sp. CU2]|uniref:SPOR domain-containing protein n=1 Tax=unclassified Mesorhizobium TaxID=325217 RepID=UPI00112E05FE|nr:MULTISPECIES: SPOR domain-containing protein [unclassified Mesorhizobium]TPN88550.1 SPOR domain-containing protein [Mesorhizobium sp. CU3]TPO21548.1 SPOR domain-containing protein [Mesorhizobium sp. CU2]